MDEKRLKQTLEDIAREDIPETMDLWPSIQNRTQHLPRWQTSQKSRLTWVAALILTLLMVAAGALALELIAPIIDPGLQEAQEADLIEALNLSQTIGDFTLTLEWVYADANRISMGYMLEGVAPATEMMNPVVVEATMMDDQGRVFQAIPVGGGGGGGGGGSDSNQITFTSFAEVSYDASVIEGAPEQLNLRLEAVVGRAPWLDNSGSGGGGGSSSEIQPSPAPAMQPVGPFVFDITIPFNPGRKLTTPMTASANSIDMTLESFVVTPSMIRAVLCFDQPANEDNKPWSPFGRLSMDGQPIIEDANLTWDYGSQPPDQISASRCNPYVVAQGSTALDQLRGEWTLSIKALRVLGSADIAEIAAVMQQQYGIIITPIPGGGYNFNTPRGADGDFLSDQDYSDLMSRIDAAVAALDTNISGPWTFTFTLP